MFNYKSVFVTSLAEPIVISFDKQENKNYRFGFTVNQEDAGYDRSVVILEDNIHWKSMLSREISTIKKDGLTYMYNCGNKIFNEDLFIMPNYEAQTVDISSKIEDKTVFYGQHTQYTLHPNIDLNTVNSQHSAYVTFKNADFTPSSSDFIFIHEDKSYIKKDYQVTPIILESNRQFVNSVFFDDEECILTVDNNGDELVVICIDYELCIDQNKEKISSIITMDGEKTNTIHYDRITSDNIRFVISDYGRLISLTQFTNNEYKEPLIMVFSDNKFKSEETVSVRLGLDYYNSINNVTANF